MGGGLALKYAATKPKDLAGVISSAALVECGSQTTPSVIEYWAVRGLSTFLQTMVMNNPVDAKQLSRDPNVAKEYNDDPYVHTLGSLEALTTIVLMGEGLLSDDYKKISVPLLMTHGTNDTQTS